MPRDSETPTVIPLTRAQVLGKELTGLGEPDGARLAEIIADLRQGVKVEPTNLIALNALVHALAFAGEADESHSLAWQAYTLMQQLPVVGTDTLLNVGAGLSEAGRVVEAKQCYELALDRERGAGDREAAERVGRNMMNLAVRFGELAWLEQIIPGHPVTAFLQSRGLLTNWAEQQAAIERIIAHRTSTFGACITPDPEDGSVRLVVDYWTNAKDSEIAAIEDAVWDAAEQVYGDHPLGLGALLGAVIICIHGPEIPLPT